MCQRRCSIHRCRNCAAIMGSQIGTSETVGWSVSQHVYMRSWLLQCQRLSDIKGHTDGRRCVRTKTNAVFPGTNCRRICDASVASAHRGRTNSRRRLLRKDQAVTLASPIGCLRCQIRGGASQSRTLQPRFGSLCRGHTPARVRIGLGSLGGLLEWQVAEEHFGLPRERPSNPLILVVQGSLASHWCLWIGVRGLPRVRIWAWWRRLDQGLRLIRMCLTCMTLRRTRRSRVGDTKPRRVEVHVVSVLADQSWLEHSWWPQILIRIFFILVTLGSTRSTPRGTARPWTRPCSTVRSTARGTSPTGHIPLLEAVELISSQSGIENVVHCLPVQAKDQQMIRQHWHRGIMWLRDVRSVCGVFSASSA